MTTYFARPLGSRGLPVFSARCPDLATFHRRYPRYEVLIGFDDPAAAEQYRFRIQLQLVLNQGRQEPVLAIA